MDFNSIKHGAELKVVKENGKFKIQYKNPGSEMFVFYLASFDHKAAENEANRISKIIHNVPKVYKTEGHFPRKRILSDELKEWTD